MRFASSLETRAARAARAMRPAESATGSRIFAVEFDWRDERPEGASESIVARIILNLRLQFFPSSSGIPREGPASRFSARRSIVPRFSPLLHARDHRRARTLSFTSGNILPISLSMQISIRGASIFAESRRKRILMYRHFIARRRVHRLTSAPRKTPR